MPILIRSQEMNNPQSTKPLKPETTIIDPPHNAPSSTESTRLGLGSTRRSPRLALDPKHKCPLADDDDPGEQDAETGRREDGKEKEILNLRSGKKIAKTNIELGNVLIHSGVSVDLDKANEVLDMKIEKEEMFDTNSLLNIFSSTGNIGVKELDIGLTSDEAGIIRKNKRKLNGVEKVKAEVIELENAFDLNQVQRGIIRKNKRKLNGAGKVEVGFIEIEDEVDLNQGQRGENNGNIAKTRRYVKEENETDNVVRDELLSDININSNTAPLLDTLSLNISGKEPMDCNNHFVSGNMVISREEKGKTKVVEDGPFSNIDDPFDLNLRLGVGNKNAEDVLTSTSREEKGKTKVVEDGPFSNIDDPFDLNLRLGVGNKNAEDVLTSTNVAIDASVNNIREENDVVVNGSVPVPEDAINNVNNARERVKDRFRDIARKNASRFAHFSSQEPEENNVDNPPLNETTREEYNGEVEDWPGLFSTAMKIIRDRESNVPIAQQNKSKTGSIKWIPKKEKSCHRITPMLQDLCINILAKNADAISSLECVPDVIRHKLCHMLCDSRKMNAQFLDLLVCGSPTEIRIRDCSWLTEEDFTRSFQMCDASFLTVLQLDQCGRCLPDYLLSDTLARSPNSLPVLTAISIKGACRLSDTGLNTLISCAPALRSINLSQCSLLTFEGINILANSLGSILRELYLDDCQGIDPILILPALSKLEQLEVLSLAGIETVSDAFVKELVAVRGRNFKELVLKDCMRLTDSSMKAIGENCTGLYALDVSNLHRLSDSTLGYLANGCRMIGRLQLSRNAFSDKAIAAYLEASGELLKELSLNNIRKVGDDTATSLARRSKNLLTLDLSWCRNLNNEALGFIVDNCLSLKVLKLFGCTQITEVFVNGHSNPQLQIIGLKMTPILKKLSIKEPREGPLHYSAVFS